MRFSALASALLACLATTASARPARPCYEQRNLNTISKIYNLTVYPNMIPVIAGDGANVPKGLFNANVTGRIDPVGKFEGFTDSIEYFFALAPIPSPATANVAITGFQITEFSSGCADVASSVVYLYCSVYNPGAANHGTPVAPLKQVSSGSFLPLSLASSRYISLWYPLWDVKQQPPSDKQKSSLHRDNEIKLTSSLPTAQMAFWKFDQNGAVEKYDAFIPNLNAWVQSTTGTSLSSPQVQGYSIQQLCATTQERCTGVNKQWNSTEECVDTLSKRNYGNYDAAWGDNVVCRSIHIFLTAVRPDVSNHYLICRFFFWLCSSMSRNHADLRSTSSTTAHM